MTLSGPDLFIDVNVIE